MSRDAGLEKCLRVGLDVFLDAQPGKNNAPRYPGRIRGWESDQYILFGLNRGARMPTLRTGASCVVRFMHEGEVWGFTAQVGDQSPPSQFPLIQMRWPKDVARLQVRKHERAPIRIACIMHLADEVSESCTICDISGGGCSITGDHDLPVSHTLHLSFAMPDGGQVSRRPVIIRNRRVDPSGAFHYGCQFQEEKEEDRGIELFVARKIAMDRGEAAPHPQLLVLSRNDDDLTIAQQGLTNSPYQAVAATGILDLGYRLRTCNAVGILISHEQKELSAIEIFPLIKQTQGLEELPLFLYGGSAGLHDQAQSMGATQCLDDLSQIEVIFQHLPKVEAVKPPVEEESDPENEVEEMSMSLDTDQNEDDGDEGEDEDETEIDIG